MSEGLQVLNVQQEGGTAKTVAAGVARIEALLPGANLAERRAVPVKHLVVGLQCGGSDGYSGISANPALGAAADLVVRHGGTVILSGLRPGVGDRAGGRRGQLRLLHHRARVRGGLGSLALAQAREQLAPWVLGATL